MKIAIMGAMIEEIEPLLDFFKKYRTVEYAGNTYYEARYKGMDIVLAYGKIGKINAALTTSAMIEKFGAEQLLFSGVAGAISEDLKIGDLVIASKLCQHDVDITAFGHPYGFVPEGKIFVESSRALRDVAKEVADEKQISIKEGIIATGDQFIADPKRKQWIKNTFDADVLEMEGAAVAVVCDLMHVPFFVLRAISDAADMDANFDFDEFLKSSSKISADFIISMLDKLA